VPLDPRIQEGGDTGRPIVAALPDSRAARELAKVAELVTRRLTERMVG
jgi:ATP-binding protein involved in chromosome partitioning